MKKCDGCLKLIYRELELKSNRIYIVQIQSAKNGLIIKALSIKDKEEVKS